MTTTRVRASEANHRLTVAFDHRRKPRVKTALLGRRLMALAIRRPSREPKLLKCAAAVQSSPNATMLPKRTAKGSALGPARIAPEHQDERRVMRPNCSTSLQSFISHSKR